MKPATKFYLGYAFWGIFSGLLIVFYSLVLGFAVLSKAALSTPADVATLSVILKTVEVFNPWPMTFAVLVLAFLADRLADKFRDDWREATRDPLTKPCTTFVQASYVSTDGRGKKDYFARQSVVDALNNERMSDYAKRLEAAILSVLTIIATDQARFLARDPRVVFSQIKYQFVTEPKQSLKVEGDHGFTG